MRPPTGACKLLGGDQAAAALSLWSSFAGRKPGWHWRKACSSVSFSTAVRTSRKGCAVALLQRICCALTMRQPQPELGQAGLRVTLDAGELGFGRHTRLELRDQLHPPHQLFATRSPSSREPAP
jgi:hypothetical protein